MSPLVWPCRVLTPSNMALDLVAATRSGGRSLSGIEQAISTGAQYWKASCTVPIRTRDQVLTWRALAAALDGRASAVLMPFPDYSRTPWPTVAGVRQTHYAPLPFADGTLFSDGSGFRERVVSAVVQPAPQGATSVTLTIIAAGLIQPGHQFSIGERLYRIKRGFSVAGSTSGTFVITPALRDEIRDPLPAEFDRPVCRMRLADDTALDLDLDLARFGQPKVTFVEAL